MKTLAIPAALAALLFASAAPAATVTFSSNAGIFEFGNVVTFIDATGSFKTAGDDGAFSLGSGLLAFELTGEETVFEFSGDFRSLDGLYRLGLADLTRFSTTLSGGQVTAISFGTRPTAVPLFNGGEPIGESDTLTYDVRGESTFDFDTFESADFTTVTSARYGDQGGSFNIDSVAPGAVPEPATWGMMIIGFAAIGHALRRRVKVRTTVAYA